MKNKIFLAILFILLGIIVSVFFYHYSKKEERRSPKEITGLGRVSIQKQELPGKDARIKVNAETRRIHGEEVFVAEELPQLKTERKPEIPTERKENKLAHLTANPEELRIEAEEGSRARTVFNLTNDGMKAALINIYKSDENESDDAIKRKIEKLIDYKRDILPDKPGKNDLRKTAIFSGTPWLLQNPCYEVLESGKSADIQVSVDAKNLEAGEHKTNLIVLGLSKDEALIVPVYLQVNAAPKIKFVKIEVDDGFSEDTQGNSNNVANPAETVAFNIYLENAGEEPAEDLTLELSSDDSSLRIFGSIAQVPFVNAKEQFSSRFLIEVPGDAHPTIPPSLVLTITDRKGRRWTESFYVGEEGKFEYPTGLIMEKEKPQDN